MLEKEITVYFENHMNYINMHCQKYGVFLDLKT
jgi:hypothetical protein